MSMFRLKNYVSDKKGNMSMILAICLTGIGIAVGSAVDISRIVSSDQKLQDAVDAATLYAATLKGDVTYQQEASLYVSNKMQSLNLQGLSTNFTIEGNQVIGVASADVPLHFAGLIGKPTSGVAARTVVNIPSVSACIIALSETRAPGILLNGGAKIETEGCEVHTHSNTVPSMTINSGTILDVPRTCISGNSILNHSNNFDGIETGCEAAADPYASQIPIPDSSVCDYNDRVYTDMNITLSPGVYCGSHNFQAIGMQVEFEPGLYVIKNGGWNANGGEWNGDGITIYYADESRLQFNSAVKANLTAPETGPYAGVFMAEAPNLSLTQFVLNDSLGFDFEGIIHLPSREFVMNGGVTVRSRELAIVADTIIINQAQLTLEPIGGGSHGSKLVYISE